MMALFAKYLRRMMYVLVALFLLLVFIDRVIVLSAHHLIYKETDTVPQMDAILVLGAGTFAGKASPILAERLDTAFVLYKAARAPHILVTGDYSSPYYDEATTMKKYLMHRGIPESDIILDYAGFSTYDSLFRAQNVFGITKVIIVSQSFHLPRALFIAYWLGLRAIGVDATHGKQSTSVELRNLWREPLARLKAVYDLLRHAQPSFLGSGLPLAADGTVFRQ